jgi:glutamyl-tRNA reductase
MIVLHNLSFHMVGISHHTAPVGVREQLALGPAEVEALLASERAAGRHALLLSTCNRFEVYWSGLQEYEGWLTELATARGVSLSNALVRLDGAAAARHLFAVAAGLDSQVVGETEVLGQVRRAYDSARASGATSREMDLIFSGALTTGRRVRHETSLGRHPASVSSAAVEVAARELAGVIDSRCVVVLGAGEAAEGVLRSLHLTGATHVHLVNRNPERARTLASAWGASAHGWEELDQLLRPADLLFVATAASRPVLSAEQLAVLTAGRAAPLVTMDLSVPRNVEPDARTLGGVRLIDLDDLQRLCCPAAGTAAAAFQDAERVVDEELARLEQQLRGLAAAPRLAELHRHGAQVAEQEAAWALAQLEDLTEQQRLVVKEMADRLVRRVLYPVSRSMRRE